MKRALFVTLLALSACSRGDRYEVTKRKVGNEEQLVRVDRSSGKTEVLARENGVEVWREVKPEVKPTPIAVTTPFDVAAEATRLAPQIAPLPSEQLAAVDIEARLEAGPEFGDLPRVAMTIHNRSSWRITELSVGLKLNGMTEIAEISIGKAKGYSLLYLPPAGTLLAINAGESVTTRIELKSHGARFQGAQIASASGLQ